MRIAMLMASHSEQARIATALETQGIEVEAFATPQALIAAQGEQVFSAVLVDDAAPRFGERLASLQPHLATQTALIVIGEGGAASMSRALALGADDYAIRCRENDDAARDHLVQRAIARVSFKLRGTVRNLLKVGAYTLDPQQGMLSSPTGQSVLTARELTLARALFEHCDQVVGNEQLCMALCERIDASAQRAVKQHVYELRRKLQRLTLPGHAPLHIQTVYGRGYRLAA